MYGIFTYIYPKNCPNVGKYSIHGAYGYKRIFHYKPSSYWGTTNLGNPHLVGGDWNHGICMTFHIYICIGNVISSQLTFTPSFFRAIPPTSQPVIIQVLPSQIHFFSRCFNGVQPCSTTRPWVFPTIPGDGGERLRTLLMDQPWGNVAVFTPGNTWVWVGIKSNWLMYFQDMIIIWMWIKMEDLKLDQRF